eukprot:tig00001067_g6784.t1
MADQQTPGKGRGRPSGGPGANQQHAGGRPGSAAGGRGGGRPSSAQTPQRPPQTPQRPPNHDPSTPAHGGGQAGNSRKQGNAHNSHDSNRNPRKARFPEHLRPDAVRDGLKRKELFQGTVRVNPRRRHEAFVVVKGFVNDVLIDGDVAQNRAMDGDTVAIRVLPKSRWKRLGRARGAAGEASLAEDVHNCADGAEEGNGGEGEDLEALAAAGPVACSAEEEEHYQKAAIVVAIVKRSEFNRHVGLLKPCDPRGAVRPQDKFAFFIPNNARAPRFLIPLHECPREFAQEPGKFATTFFACTFVDWPIDAVWPRGRLSDKLGEAGEIEVETEALLLEHDIDSRPFNEAVQKCLPTLPWSIPAEELARRRDLRAECIYTIDPLTARDLDDALHCRALPDGSFEVGVHIADVSHFVLPGTALDREAQHRATTTYLVQKAVPMLPGVLCEELCSLNPGVDRLAFSVIWRLDAQGRVQEEWFGRSVIRSCCKLDYGRAQAIIEQGEAWACDVDVHNGFGPADLIRCTRDLHRLSLSMRKARFDSGALSLHTVRLCFNLGRDGTPVECFEYELKDSNRLVEEFMLLANMAVAGRIVAAFPDASLLRRHPPPLLRRLDDFLDFCAQHDVPFDGSSAGAIHRSLLDLERTRDPDIAAAIRSLLTKPMQTAKYFCTGDLEEHAQWGHFALAVPFYTHFTSPIRRYADVVVHRLLQAALDSERTASLEPAAAVEASRAILASLPPREAMSGVAEHCNTRKLKAKMAQEHSGLVHLCLMLRRRPLVEPAVVVLVQDRSFDVFVPRLGLEKRITLQDLEPLLEGHAHDPVARTLTLSWRPEAAAQAGAASTTVAVFDRVKVRCGTKPNKVPLDILLEYLPGDPKDDPLVAHLCASTSCLRLSRAEGLDD